MRIVFFLLGLIGFISAGILHLPWLGVLGFVLAVVAIFLATPPSPTHHDERSIQLDEIALQSLAEPVQSAASVVVLVHQPRASRRWPRHSARHHTRHALPTHINNRQRRATQKEL